MTAKELADRKISKNLKEAERLVKDCEDIAKEHKLDFYFESPMGRVESYDGSGLDFGDDDGQPTGWDHSQC